MAFRFSLSAVLRLREYRERSEERALAKIQLEIERVNHGIGRIDSAATMLQLEQEQTLKKNTTAIVLHELTNNQCELSEKRAELLASLQALLASRNLQVERYTRARQEHEALLQMRREQLAVYEQNQRRVEQSRLDSLHAARRSALRNTKVDPD